MKLHHLNISCLNVEVARQKLGRLFSFQERGWLLNKDKQSDTADISKSYLMTKGDTFLTLQQNKDILYDTVDDIAFNVDSVTQCCSNVQKYGGIVLEEPHFIDCVQRPFTKGNILNSSQSFCNCGKPCCENFIEKATVKSSVGNVKHTLLNKNNFKGDFLPGFIPSGLKFDINNPSHLINVDHVALAVHCGDTLKHINWYQNCFKMTRYQTHVTESKSGLVIRGRNGNGLRMLTLIEHPCSETSLISNNEIEIRNDEVKFVFVESLKDEGSDQVQTFLNHHNGPGVQHVAFHSNDIARDAQSWKNSGVSFIKPPPAYYEEISSTLAKIQDTHDVKDLSDIGILIDAEKQNDEDGVDGYLYQVFTEPIFDTHTFFFELIQRDNARGFGAGNVSALWRALDSHFHAIDLNRSS